MSYTTKIYYIDATSKKTVNYFWYYKISNYNIQTVGDFIPQLIVSFTIVELNSNEINA